jgi:hypothetical protein
MQRILDAIQVLLGKKVAVEETADKEILKLITEIWTQVKNTKLP